MSLFKNQTNVTLLLNTGKVLTGFSSVKVLARKPSGTKVSFNGNVVDGTKISYTFKQGELDQTGFWEFQAYAEGGQGASFGEIVRLEVKNNLL